MIYSIVSVFKKIKSEGGIQLRDEIQALVVDQIVNDQQWQEKAAKNCVHAFDSLMETIDGDDIEKLDEIIKASRNVQDPVWTRWMTTLRAAILVVDNWTICYFTMIVCKASKKASSNLAKTANDALLLMDTASSGDCETPSFYAQLLFLKAFSKAFYKNAYEMSMWCDPQYGRASHGYTSRHCVERCYVMKKQLIELKSGWKTHPDFCHTATQSQKCPSWA